MTDRVTRLRAGATRENTRVIEIGPSHAPIAPKADGWRTFVVDHTDQAGLREKFSGLGVELDAIEPVDAIWSGGPLDAVVPAAVIGSFDLLIASHVFEHLPDPIGFLDAASRLLKPEGVISLAIPDKRFCFDYFRPITTTAEMLEARFARRIVHPARTLWNHATSTITMDGVGAWGQHPVFRAAFQTSGGFTQAEAEARFAAPAESAPYEDAHAWILTPAIFTLIMIELAQLEMTQWKIRDCEETLGCEFLVRLVRGATPMTDLTAFQDLRLQLARRHSEELQEQLRFAEGGRFASEPSLPAGQEGLVARLDDHELRLGEIEARLQRIRRAVGPLLAVLRLLGLYPPLRPRA
ncbi:MAG: class I SAM-dependent methyltransferase [Acetobacteraceae bacterium]